MKYGSWMSDTTKADLVHFAMSRFGIRVLTPPYQILVQLYENGECCSGDLLAISRLTSATFQKYLADLLERQLINWKRDPNDGRRHHYQLTPNARTILDEELTFPARWRVRSNNPENSLFDHLDRMWKRLGIRTFSSEFIVLLSLYDKGRMTTGQLLSFNHASPGVFYVTLRRLSDLKHIREVPTTSDGRQKLHELSERSKRLMEQIHFELSEWAKRLK
jgi:DNA-binding MarR family transcriptional regulator